MNKEESKTIPLRQATYEELTEVITDLHTQNYLKEMENVRLHSIIKEVREYIKEDMYVEPMELYGLIDGEHILRILDKENK